jgi:translocator protein
MDWSLFVVFFLACAAAAATGNLFQPGAWYDGLRKPVWTPPRWAYPVAWTFFYTAIAVAAARVGSLPGSVAAIGLFTLQLVLNAIWSPVFFGLRRPDKAAVIIALLWLAVAATTIAFLRLDAIAGGIFVLYLGWVSFAGGLNVAVWRLNPTEPGIADA